MTVPENISADYTLRPSELAAVLALLVEARQPCILWGPPGSAKSMIAQQVAASASRRYVDVRALLLDPVDLRGIPWRDGADRTRWAPPAFLPPSDDSGRWLINLEELPSAVPMVQAALYQLVLDRKVGEYELPEGARRSSPAATGRPTAASSTACPRRLPPASSISRSGSTPRTGSPGVRPTGSQPRCFSSSPTSPTSCTSSTPGRRSVPSRVPGHGSSRATSSPRLSRATSYLRAPPARPRHRRDVQPMATGVRCVSLAPNRRGIAPAHPLWFRRARISSFGPVRIPVSTTHSPDSGTFVSGTRCGDFAGRSHLRTRAQSRAGIECPRARVPQYGRMRIFSNDRPAHGCARVIPGPFPGRLRSHVLANCTIAFRHAITAPVRDISSHRAVDS